MNKKDLLLTFCLLAIIISTFSYLITHHSGKPKEAVPLSPAEIKALFYDSGVRPY